MDNVCVVVVTFYAEKHTLRSVLNSIAADAHAVGLRLSIVVWDNTPDSASLDERMSRLDFGDLDVILISCGENLGFGRAVNRVLLNSEHEWAFVLNQDANPFPSAFLRAISYINTLPNDVGVVEFRQFPFEHPKAYDPVTLETGWAAGAAFFVKVEAFNEVGGFEEKFFMYSEDVDLSFKLRAAGRSIIYLPRCVVDHACFSESGQQKPLQALHDRANNLLLRARYGSLVDFLGGLCWYFCELPFRLANKDDIGFAKTIRYVLANFLYFRRTGYKLRRHLNIGFRRWHYGQYRYGADFQMPKYDSFPLVSIIIRTKGRAGFLREAVRTVINQSYPKVQIVIVNDGLESISSEVASFAIDEKRLVLINTGGQAGRAAAGNLGLENAAGQLVGFLDDDDQLYADHVETLVGAYLKGQSRVVYSLAEEVKTEVIDAESGIYQEEGVSLQYGPMVFSRVLLWYKNYIPIQSAMFERKLFEELGGFDECLDHYEDWSLWVKYSTVTDFINVGKVTSRYRVPAKHAERRQRQLIFKNVYKRVQATQNKKTFLVSPADFRTMVAEYLKLRGIFCITKESLCSIAQAVRVFVGRWFG